MIWREWCSFLAWVAGALLVLWCVVVVAIKRIDREGGAG